MDGYWLSVSHDSFVMLRRELENCFCFFSLTLSRVTCCGFFLLTVLLIVCYFGQKCLIVNVNVLLVMSINATVWGHDGV